MSRTLDKKEQPHFLKDISSGSVPQRFYWGAGSEPARIEFSDGKTSIGSCIRCFNPPCMYFEPEDVESRSLREFPADQNTGVCPTSAILWSAPSPSPVVDTEDCIYCGICVSRCPVKAIYIGEDGAVINDQPNLHFVERQRVSTQERTERIAKQFRGLAQAGVAVRESDKILIRFRKKIEMVGKHQGAQFPNLLARNLLLNVGVGASMRRRGDTNVRMDLILGPPGVKTGIAEIEFGDAIVEAPRSILDSFAVMYSRYSIPRKEIIPLIVCLDLPNQRSEYWQLISDIKKILGIEIGTLTIGTLVLLGWNKVDLILRSSQPIYLDAEDDDLRPKIERLLKRKLDIRGSGYAGLLRSEK